MFVHDDDCRLSIVADDSPILTDYICCLLCHITIVMNDDMSMMAE